MVKVCRDFLGFESGMSCCCRWRFCGIGINVVIRLHTFKMRVCNYVFLLNIMDVPYRTISVLPVKSFFGDSPGLWSFLFFLAVRCLMWYLVYVFRIV